MRIFHLQTNLKTPSSALLEVKTLTLGSHRGSPRLWVIGRLAERAGFHPGAAFTVEPGEEAGTIVVKLARQGERTVSRKRYASGRVVPVLDINSGDSLGALSEVGVVKVQFYPGRIQLSALDSHKRLVRRLARLRQRLARSQPLELAGVCAGGGVLSHAVHAGLADARVPSTMAVFNELREDLVEQAASANSVIGTRTSLMQLPLQELAFDESVLRTLPEVDLIELGLPCSGASLAGRARRRLRHPEEHPDVGHLVVAALALVARLNPAVCLFENVVPYASTASASLLRNQLRDFGYELHETTLLGTDFGALEARKRWCLLALSRGISLDLRNFVPRNAAKASLAEVLEPADAAGLRWSEMPGLLAKQERDQAGANNFKMQVFDAQDTCIGTLTKGIYRNRSTDPKIRHPDNPALLRVPTAREHARCKGVPEVLIEGLSHSRAHELLGQSVVYEPFRQLCAFLGKALVDWSRSDTCKSSPARAPVAAG